MYIKTIMYNFMELKLIDYETITFNPAFDTP